MYLESGMPLNELTAQGARKKMNNCVMYLEKRSELSMIHREGIIKKNKKIYEKMITILIRIEH